MLYEEAVKDGTTDIYSQEYLNQPIDESVSFFKKGDFLNISEEDRKTRLNYYITADLAISESEKADFSVFVIAGVDENKIIHTKNVIRERMDGKEIVDTFLALQKLYDPVAIGVEDRTEFQQSPNRAVLTRLRSLIRKRVQIASGQARNQTVEGVVCTSEFVIQITRAIEHGQAVSHAHHGRHHGRKHRIFTIPAVE